MTPTPPSDAVERVALKPCPWCNGLTAYAQQPNIVRHIGEPHCPVINAPLTTEQWNFRASMPDTSRQAGGEDTLAAIRQTVFRHTGCSNDLADNAAHSIVDLLTQTKKD